MDFGVYVHIPYCLQRCRYCDFTTFEFSEIMPPEKYLQILLREIQQRSSLFEPTKLASLYFGGGTPSLIPASSILSIISELANCGFEIDSDSEVTIEINPATIDEEKLDFYIKSGINRFSVGAQSFDDDLLKLCGRRHLAEDTRHTLRLLRERNLNYSFDLLFALPSQTLDQLKEDLDEVELFDPPHLSAYCLTVPSGHPMAKNRPPEGTQIDMFEAIEERLRTIGVSKYEISNFSKPKRESRHNLLYWKNGAYWGLGLSAHSYDPRMQQGVRFWNPSGLDTYESQIYDLQGDERHLGFPSSQIEYLKVHEALTDFCHTSLRIREGLSLIRLFSEFGHSIGEVVVPKLIDLEKSGFLVKNEQGWTLTSKGERLSNRIFLELTFERQDFAAESMT